MSEFPSNSPILTTHRIRMIRIADDKHGPAVDHRPGGITQTNGKEAMRMSLNSRVDSVSLRKLFPSAQIVGAGDISCHSCSSSLEGSSCNSEDLVFAVGLGDCPDLSRETIEAINFGAKAILTEQFLPSSVPQCIVPDVREAFAQLCHALADHPSKKMLTIGVVGTHGKTTAALITASMLKQVGNRVAYHTSLGASNGRESGLLAPADANAEQLCEWLQHSADNQTPAAVIELSDEMLCSHATAGIEFDVLLFTGLRKSQRLDTLRSRGVENALHRVVGQLKNHGVIVFNADDARLNRWISRHQPHAIGYGLDALADVRGKRLNSVPGEQSLMISAGSCVTPLTTTILGDHNARHVLGATAVGYAFGLELFEIVQGIERMQRIPGRMQRVPVAGRCSVYVDCADQADRLAVALHSLARSGNPITCVAEVPEAATPDQLAAYGRVLERAASRVILTQNRVSTKMGQKGAWQVLDGCEYPSNVQVVPNREVAIELALRSARPGEQVLLAGWGNDRWTNGKNKETFTDLQCASKWLADLPTETEKEPQVAAIPNLRLFGGAA